MTLNPGILNRTISIVKPQPAQGSNWGASPELSTLVLSCRASIRAATSKEVYAASGFTSEVSHVVLVRYPKVRILAGMRVLYDDRAFHVQAADDPDEDRTTLKILCLELNGGTA